MNEPVHRKLRIAYVAAQWDYGDPTRGPSFEEMNFRSALEGMGHEVHAYDFLSRFQAVGQKPMNAELDRFVRNVEPDLAFFVLFKDEIEPDTIAGLTASGIKTFNWFCDDHWRFDSFSQHYAPQFSLVSTTHAESVSKYHAIGYPSVVLTQWACNRYAYGKRGSDLKYDVTFVGQRYGERPKIVRAIQSAGIDIRCWGYGWEAGRLDHESMVGVFESSRINLNLANSWTGRLFRRRPAVEQIKARLFEVPGSGGFLLTQPAPHLDAYFELDTELGTFHGTSDLVERIRHWLANEEQRVRAAGRSHQRVLEEHTYDHRFREIFAAAGLTHA
jgi:spore maturation protein CgeB